MTDDLASDAARMAAGLAWPDPDPYLPMEESLWEIPEWDPPERRTCAPTWAPYLFGLDSHAIGRMYLAPAAHAAARARTHCKHGHDLADAYVNEHGHRHCRVCARIRSAAYYSHERRVDPDGKR